MARDRNRFSRWLARIGVAFLLAGALARPAAAQSTYHVSTVAELESMATLINAGPGGDVIAMSPGLYVLNTSIQFRRNVTLKGDPALPTIVDGNGNTMFTFSASAVVQDLTLRNGFPAISFESPGVFTGSGLTVTDSAIGLDAGDGEGNFFLTNSTVANNSGNGIQVSCGNMHLTNDTISGNAAGIRFNHPCGGDVMQITNTLVVGNTVDCSGGVSGIVALATASLDTDGTCVSRGFAAGMSTVSIGQVDLHALTANGGPTETQMISSTSIAADAGDNAACPATDQRGELRSDGACDIGAYEDNSGAPVGNTPIGKPVVLVLAPGITVQFAEVTLAGDTTVGPSTTPPPANFQVDGMVYEITTTAQFDQNAVPAATVCLPYNPVSDPNPVLSHFEGGNWVPKAGVADPVSQTVCAGVQSFSPFAVLMPPNVASQLEQLEALVDSFNLRKPVARRFEHRLDQIRDAWIDTHHHRHSEKEFCKELDKFIKDVRKESGRKLTAGEAAQLLALSQLIAGEVGCGP